MQEGVSVSDLIELLQSVEDKTQKVYFEIDSQAIQGITRIYKTDNALESDILFLG